MIRRETRRVGSILAGLFLAMFFVVYGLGGAVAEGDSPEPRTEARMYRNPFQLENEWFAYGIGDPFILRWNGRYYLYPSTRTHGGGEIGVRVWISEDLVDWKYAGYASRDRVTYNAFAPEVVYWNGSFYMYQSSDGQGHYVLKSDEPTGLFTAQTGNIGLSIDGSVFIDDDGSWYFTHAGFRGIRGYKMTDPYTVGTPRLLEADLGAWTEGSMIIKRDGYYFITYTGNHVRSAGYRIHYAVSEDGPLGPYVEWENNPLLLSTDDDFHGLGHNSLVLAPDLDGHMIVYHNIYNRHADHIRKMNIDRLVFNGKKMAALGPTTFPQVAPKLPEFYTWIDEDGIEGRWTVDSLGEYDLLLSREETESRFTAEFNFQLATEVDSQASPRIGSVVSYRGDQSFVTAIIDPRDDTLSIWDVEGDEWRLLAQRELQLELDWTKLHSLRIAHEPGRMRVFLDQLLLLELALDPMPGGKIGYIYRDVTPVFRYTAFSNDAFGSSDRRVPKPIPGKIEAIHFQDGQVSPDGAHVTEAGDGTFAVALAQPGQGLNYTIHVEKDGLYAVDVVARKPVDTPVLEWQVDGATVLTTTLPEPWPAALASEAPAAGDSWFKVPLGRLELKAGLHTLRMELGRGGVEVKRIDLYPVAEAPFSLIDPLTQGVSDAWREYGEATWESTESGFRLTRSRESMIIAGSPEWADYSVKVDFEVEGPLGPGEASLILRATNPSYHPDEVRDSVVAYAVTLKDDRILLQKLNYNSTTLASAPVETRGTHVLAVKAEGPFLKIYLDDLERPVIEYADPDAWMYGAVGLRANTTNITFRNFVLDCTTCPVYGRLNVAGHSFWLTPNRERYEVVLPFGVTTPPPVEATTLGPGAGVDVIALDARIEVIQATSVPGEAHIRVWDPENTLLHEAVVALSKITVPSVGIDVPGGKGKRDGWAGDVVGDVPVVVDVNGPDELLKDVRVTLSRIDFGEAVDERLLYQGAGVPDGLVLDTADLADATYEIAVHVKSIYDTEAHGSIRLRVANWREFVDELLPPFESFFGLIDRSETVVRTDGWRHETESPGDFFGDRDRMVRQDDTTEHLVWEAPGLRQIVVTVYARDLGERGDTSRIDALLETVALDVSADMNEWAALPVHVESVRESESGWSEVQLVGSVANAVDEEGAGYVRVSLREGAYSPDAVQLGRVRLLSRP